jgi:hypothetical protein
MPEPINSFMVLSTQKAHEPAKLRELNTQYSDDDQVDPSSLGIRLVKQPSAMRLNT